MRRIFDYIINSSFFAWLILPLAIYNLVTSFFELRKQHKILKDVINGNSDFFKVLQTYGFTKSKFYGLSAKFETNLEMSEEEVYDLANKNMILAIKNYVVNEMLFNVVKIEGYHSKNNEIVIELNPANRKLFLLDIKNIIISFFVFLLFLASYILVLWLN